ncbi:S26 family signal peptidase [Actinoallomurus sp. CA-150999]|uniref:S26 family signal peptidase n=1 Tax=Actinoallomurus sp. CA-150999 TaxID=3239887 RepID=UPI003D92BBE1
MPYVVGFGLAVATVTAVLVTVRTRLAVVRIWGVSMTPTLQPGDRVLLIRRNGSRVRTGQIVVFQGIIRDTWSRDGLPSPARELWTVKRVAAVAGEPVPAAMAESSGAVVPPGQLVVLGDGLLSRDSRDWGYLPADRVLGIVVRKLKPGDETVPAGGGAPFTISRNV